MQMAGRLGLTLREYQALEAGELWIDYDMCERITEVCGWLARRRRTRCSRRPAPPPFATSAERARIISELTERNPGTADLLMELEADADLRARFEIELLNEGDAAAPS